MMSERDNGSDNEEGQGSALEGLGVGRPVSWAVPTQYQPPDGRTAQPGTGECQRQHQ